MNIFKKNQMKFSRSMALACVFTLISGAFLCSDSARAQGAERPNIIFFIGDDMDRFMFNFLLDQGDADAIEQQVARGFAGQSVLSPNMNKLATEGVTFPNQYVVSAACTPTRYSVLTGRFGSRATNITWDNYDGMTYPFFNMSIQTNNVTLAKLLQQGGYRTGFAGKDHVHGYPYDNGSSIGMSSDYPPYSPETMAWLTNNYNIAQDYIKSCGYDYAESIYLKNPVNLPPGLQVHNMDWIAKGGVDFIEECATSYAEQPFFLYFATTLTHAPNGNTDAWLADRTATYKGNLSFDSPLKEADGTTWTRDTIASRMVAAGLPDPIANNSDRLSHLLWLDDSLGALLDKLEEHGLDDNTIIFFFDDHGVEFGGKAGLYEHGAKCATIVWKKSGFACGTNSTAMISNVDFAPTILDYAGVEMPFEHFDGKSFRSLLEGNVSEIRNSAYLEFGCGRGVIMDNWKYLSVRWPNTIYDSRFDDPSANDMGWASLKGPLTSMEVNVRAQHPNYYDVDQLYNLAADPGEQTNLASDPAHADRLQLMKDELQKYLDPNPGPYAEFKSSGSELKKGAVIELL
jgi:arylsulfatase A-like enzyme